MKFSCSLDKSKNLVANKDLVEVKDLFKVKDNIEARNQVTNISHDYVTYGLCLVGPVIMTLHLNFRLKTRDFYSCLFGLHFNLY